MIFWILDCLAWYVPAFLCLVFAVVEVCPIFKTVAHFEARQFLSGRALTLLAQVPRFNPQFLQIKNLGGRQRERLWPHGLWRTGRVKGADLDGLSARVSARQFHILSVLNGVEVLIIVFSVRYTQLWDKPFCILAQIWLWRCSNRSWH